MRSIARQASTSWAARGACSPVNGATARLAELIADARAASGERQDVVVRDLCRLVFTHAFAEEAVLWPAARRALPDGTR